MTDHFQRCRSGLVALLSVLALSCSSAEPGVVPAAEGVDAGLDGGVTSGDGIDTPDCAEGTPCDDGDPCTDADTCAPDGDCVGTALDCDDGLECTTDQCADGLCAHTLHVDNCISDGEPPLCVELVAPDPRNSCRLCAGAGADGSNWTVLVDGAPCDDRDACTLADLCELGQCVSKTPKTCPEGGPCTVATCDSETGCGFEFLDEPCDDGDACTQGDTCGGGECVPGPEAPACDDGDPCTTDLCEPAIGCVTAPACDDGDPCTEDSCEPNDGSCLHSTANNNVCDDGDPCTVGDSCESGVCLGGDPNPCDDDNMCTMDQCDTALVDGCQHFFLDADPCNDSIACTGPDVCISGLCVGEKTLCPACPPPDTDHALKATQFELATDGFEGSGLDVDEDPTTCAPANNCGGGVDNALAPLAALLNEPMSNAVNNGGLLYVGDLGTATPEVLQNGLPFSLAILDTQLTQESSEAGCDFQAEICEYTASQENYSGACQPWFYFDDAVYEDGVVTAGGKGHIITILMALGGQDIPLTIGHARLQGNAVLDVSGDHIIAMNGVIAGATPKAQLIETLENIDPSLLILPTESIVSLLELLVQNDLDLDGDGEDDAASVGLRFKMIPAILK